MVHCFECCCCKELWDGISPFLCDGFSRVRYANGGALNQLLSWLLQRYLHSGRNLPKQRRLWIYFMTSGNAVGSLKTQRCFFGLFIYCTKLRQLKPTFFSIPYFILFLKCQQWLCLFGLFLFGILALSLCDVLENFQL